MLEDEDEALRCSIAVKTCNCIFQFGTNYVHFSNTIQANFKVFLEINNLEIVHYVPKQALCGNSHFTYAGGECLCVSCEHSISVWDLKLHS